jgi:hypothetical protein
VVVKEAGDILNGGAELTPHDHCKWQLCAGGVTSWLQPSTQQGGWLFSGVLQVVTWLNVSAEVNGCVLCAEVAGVCYVLRV